MKATTPDPDVLTQMLTRLKLTAIRDQLDSLLDISITELQVLLCLRRRCACDRAEGRDRFVVHRGGVLRGSVGIRGL